MIFLEKKACAMIRRYLSDVALYSIIEERTPKGLWLKLYTLYIRKNMYNKHADPSSHKILRLILQSRQQKSSVHTIGYNPEGSSERDNKLTARV